MSLLPLLFVDFPGIFIELKQLGAIHIKPVKAKENNYSIISQEIENVKLYLHATGLDNVFLWECIWIKAIRRLSLEDVFLNKFCFILKDHDKERHNLIYLIAFRDLILQLAFLVSFLMSNASNMDTNSRT